MADDKIKVLYIAGMRRSGSTILGNVLGQMDGFVHVGELQDIWDRSFVRNWLCGCGVRFRDCNLWRAVLEKAFGSLDQNDAYEMIRLRKSCSRMRHIPLMTLPGGKFFLVSRLGEYTVTLESLYRAIQSVTESKVIVDSSKNPPYGHVLELMPAIDLYVVHLIRDPRATAYSLIRKKFLPDTGQYIDENTNPVWNAGRWTIWNLTSELFFKGLRQRYLRLRYEEFVRNPREVVKQIVRLVEEEAPKLPFVADHTVELGLQHTTSGNPTRHKTGIVELQPDDEWKTRMRKRDKLMVTATTWPLLLRYGYLAKTDTGH